MRLPNVDHIRGQLRPRWRGVLHTYGAVVALPAGISLALVAQGLASVAVGIYVACLVTTFGVSAAYHRVARTPRSQQVMRRADHAAIYLLIAGTYTPVCLLALPRAWGVPLLVVVWTAAAVGVTCKLTARAWHTATGLYLVLGWVGLVAMPVLWTSAGPGTVALFVAGGVVYTIGAVLFLLQRPRLSPTVWGHHETWHAATVAAAVLHFAAVAGLAR